MTTTHDPIFQPLKFKNLTIKNRIFRSNMTGRFDNYDGSGNDTRIHWELKFARGGVGAILSNVTAVHEHGRVIPEFATITHPDSVRFWKKLGKYVHAHDTPFIVQLSHAGRQRDIHGFEFPKGLSSTDKEDPLHGFPCERMTEAQILEVIEAFRVGAARVREAGLDGIEVHAAQGYLLSQFLSSAINDRDDSWGGSLENRYRLFGECLKAVRKAVGNDFHVQVKYSIADFGRALFPWLAEGNTVEEGVQVAKWLERDGADAIHVASGNMFPHPNNPPGPFPTRAASRTYAAMVSEGKHTLRNYIVFRTWPLSALFDWAWQRTVADLPREGINVPLAKAVKQAVGIPVIVTGGFQHASKIREVLGAGEADAVSIARGLIANPDLVRWFEKGEDCAPVPCTNCNKCLAELLQNPTACYEESRYEKLGGREAMVRDAMAVYAADDLPEEPEKNDFTDGKHAVGIGK